MATSGIDISALSGYYQPPMPSDPKHVTILGIETSCDETAAAIVTDGRDVRSSVVASQTKLHEKYGGVVPEIASRAHIENIHPVVTEALEQAGAN